MLRIGLSRRSPLCREPKTSLQRVAAALAFVVFSPIPALAQPLSAAESDPTVLGCMEGFPPPPDKRAALLRAVLVFVGEARELPGVRRITLLGSLVTSKAIPKDVDVLVEVSDEMRPGVVCLPHGWGHDKPGTRLRVAAEHAGVCNNVLAPGGLVDTASGNAVVNGIPVTVERG